MPSERNTAMKQDAESNAPINHEAPASEPSAPVKHEAPASEPTTTLPRQAPVAETAQPRTPADPSAGAGAHRDGTEGVQNERNASAGTDDRSPPRSEPVAPAPAAAAGMASDPIEPKSST
jgi:ribonuclease E